MLTKFLIRLFVRKPNELDNPAVRLNYGVFSGYVGVIVNFLLFALKLTMGILSGSVAIAADAINNLSDSGSAAVTIIGFKISAKPADKDHPFGHGRVEYIAGVVVAVIIIAVGFDFLKESIFRIFEHGSAKIDLVMLIIIGFSMLFKGWLFFFYRYVGNKIHSPTLNAAAFDSLSDIGSTAVILIALLAEKYFNLAIDGYVGTIVSVLVLIAGIKVLRDTINPLLGEPPSKEFVDELEARLLQIDGITGVHDVIIHNYGPNQYFATAHAEVDLQGDLLSVHDLLEGAEIEIGKSMPIHLLLHCDPCNTYDAEISSWRVKLETVVAVFDNKFKVYDFRLTRDGEKLIFFFHVLIPRNYYLSGDEIKEHLLQKMREHSDKIELQVEFMNSYV